MNELTLNELRVRMEYIEDVRGKMMSWLENSETRYYRVENRVRSFADYTDGQHTSIYLLDTEIANMLYEWLDYHYTLCFNKIHIPPSPERIRKILFQIFNGKMTVRSAEKQTINRDHNWSEGAPPSSYEYEDVVYVIPPYTVPLEYTVVYNGLKKKERLWVLDPDKTDIINPVEIEFEKFKDRFSKKGIPENVIEKMFQLYREGYHIYYCDKDTLELEACNTHTTVEICSSNVEVLYGDVKVEDKIETSEFPTGSWMGSGKHIVRVYSRPSVIRYKLYSEKFGQRKDIIIFDR